MARVSQIHTARTMPPAGRSWRTRVYIYGGLLCGLLCSPVSRADAAAKQPVSQCTIARDASAFDGKRVKMRAVYHHAFEISALTCPCDADRRIWIGPGLQDLPPSLAAALRRQKRQVFAAVEVEGRFRSTGGPFGHLGFYPYALEGAQFRRATVLLETDHLIGEPVSLRSDVCRE